MEGDVSLGKVVQTIMESLSEAISQLILYVISMQETNAAPPPHIPQAAEGVTSASNTLADVASSLAEEEYEGYPDIQQPIIEAAKDVKHSGENLIQATNNLKNSANKAEGWSRLLDACRIISGQTCFILQLVYGAELKRMLLAAEAAKELANQTRGALAATNPQQFADKVSEIAGSAEALANNLYEQLKGEESPLRREELKRAADNLKVYSDELPNLANKALANPKDPKPQAIFDAKVADLVKELDNISAPVREKLNLLPEKPPKIETISVPPKNDTKPTRAPHSGASKNLPQFTKPARDTLANFAKAVERQDAPLLANSANELAGQVNDITDALDDAARNSRDPERAKQLRNTSDNIKKYTPKAIAVGAQSLKDGKPNVPELSKVTKQLDALLEFAQDVAKPAPEVEAAAVAKDLLRDLPRLEIAAHQGDEAGVDSLAKKVNDILPFLRQSAKDLGDRHPNPKVKATLTKALANVDKSVPEAVKNAKANSKNPSDTPSREQLAKAVETAEQALHDIINAGSDILGNLRKQSDDVASLDVLAALEEPKQLAAVEKEVAKRQPKIADKALAVAGGAPDIPAKAAVNKEVLNLEKLLPEQIEICRDVVNKPSADEPKKKLKKSATEMGKALDNVAAAVKELPPLSVPSKSPHHKLEAVQDLLDALKAAQDGGEQDLTKILENLSPTLEQWLAEAPEKSKEEILEDKIADVGGALGDAIERLAEVASKAKSPKDVEAPANDVTRLTKDFLEAVRPYIEKYAEEEDKPLLEDALGDLAALIPELVKSATDVAKNPRDPRAKKKLDDLADAGNKNVKFVIKKINKTPEEKKADAVRKFPKGVKKVVDNLDKGGDDLAGALDRLKKVIRDLNQPIKDDSPNYTAGRNIAEAIAELEKRLAEKNKKSEPNAPQRPFQDAKNFFQNVLNDPKPQLDPKVEIAANAKEVKNLLDRLEAAALAPGNDPKKLLNVSKAIGSKIDALIKKAKPEAAGIKDPKARAQVEAALANLEKEFQQLVNDGIKPFVQNPSPEQTEKLQDFIQQLKAPLDDIADAFSPNEVAHAAKEANKAAQKLAKAAKAGDPKAAGDALKALKDASADFTKQAKTKAARLPPKAKDSIERKIKALDDTVKALEPAVQELAKKPADVPTQDRVAELAKSAIGPIDSIVQDLVFADKSQQDEVTDLVKQIVASIKQKNIKKIDPSNLIKISKHLAGLLSDMVSKTGVDIRGSNSGLTDRAKAALELEALLASLENDAKRSNPSPSQQQNIDNLLASLNLSAGGSQAQTSNAPTQLSQQISSVVKEIRAKSPSSGSLEGAALYQISQSLASDLQKFADADSGNSRSDLIVLGRAISANIVRLADELKRLASVCTDPKMQNKLLLHSQVLRNYATQLKIMASVRAASPRTAKDSSSDQLVILTQNLAGVIGDATNAVSIMKQTKRGQV